MDSMSVQTGRMVSANEARDWCHGVPTETAIGQMVQSLAHTVVVQAEQIAAAREWHSKAHWCNTYEGGTDWFSDHEHCPTAQALGVSGE